MSEMGRVVSILIKSKEETDFFRTVPHPNK